jgi:hypothetical protein
MPLSFRHTYNAYLVNYRLVHNSVVMFSIKPLYPEGFEPESLRWMVHCATLPPGRIRVIFRYPSLKIALDI